MSKAGCLISKNADQRFTAYYDLHAASPRDVDYNLGEMYCWHNRRELGDSNMINKPNTEDYTSFDELIEDNFAEEDLILPIYMLDHGGIRLSTTPFTSTWDSGQLGFILMHKEDVIRYFKGNLDSAKEALKDEVECYSEYLQGNCYIITHEVLTKDGAWETMNIYHGIIGDWVEAVRYDIDNFSEFDEVAC